MWKRLNTLIVASAVFLAATAPAAMAWQAEGGSKNCGSTIGYVHLRFNDYGYGYGPGGEASPGSWLYTDNLWHVKEKNGTYSGDWFAYGDPYLDLPQTWAGCRSYG